MAEVLTDKEQEIVELAIRALPKHLVVVKPVKVFTVEEGESSQLPVHGTMGASPFNRDRIASDEQPAVLAKEVRVPFENS